MFVVSFFFFQAEDGIRDKLVTGVQTCALPILGDASELDVRLAEVNAGQLENVAADDALAAVDALLAVQLAMGLPAETPTITLADSLVPPPPPLDSAPAPATEPLRVAAAAASLRSSERALTLAHRSVLPAPSLQAGFDHGDPTR